MTLNLPPKVRKALKITGWTVGVVMTLIVSIGMVLNSSWAQKRIMNMATAALSEKLGTKVAMESVNVNILTHEARFQGLCVEDLQHRKMLEADRMEARIKWWGLPSGKVHIQNAKLCGVTARLYKSEEDSVPNFQFVIDAFKSDSTKAQTKTEFTLKSLTAERISLIYNTDSVTLARLTLEDIGEGMPTGGLNDLKLSMASTNYKNETTHHHITLRSLKLSEINEIPNIELEVHYLSDNHLPRKNAGNPKRGYFDAGHFDAVTRMHFIINYFSPDSVNATLTECTASDTTAGFDIRDLRFTVAANKRLVNVTNLVVRQIDTEVRVPTATVTFPDEKAGTPITYSTGTITGNTTLRDISHLFAPILHKFTLPLRFSAVMSGDDNKITFTDAVVSTPDNKFTVSAAGYVDGLRYDDDKKMVVHFDVPKMTAARGMPQKILNEFPFRKFMMKQLNALGNIHYKGYFDIFWKDYNFYGSLGTAAGALKFKLNVDALNDYISGNVSAGDVQLGKILDMPDIGSTSATAQFRVDISTSRTAAVRRKKGGELPIGSVKAHVTKASYKFITTTNVTAEIESDGAVATGSINAPAKVMDVGCTFTFTDTDNLKKMKIKPNAKLHIFESDKKDDKGKTKKKK